MTADTLLLHAATKESSPEEKKINRERNDWVG